MEDFDENTKVVDTFDVNKEFADVSASNLLSYDEMLKYLKNARAMAVLLQLSSTQNPLVLLLSKESRARQGYSEGFNKGYIESLNIFKQAIKHSWDSAFTISNLINLYKNYEIKYKDAVRKNNSQTRFSSYYKYYNRTALCAIIDTWEKYAGLKD